MGTNNSGNGLSLFRERIKARGVRSDRMARLAYAWFMRLEPEAQEVVASQVYAMMDKKIRNFGEQSGVVVIYCLNRYLAALEEARRLEPGSLGVDVMRAANGEKLMVEGGA